MFARDTESCDRHACRKLRLKRSETHGARRVLGNTAGRTWFWTRSLIRSMGAAAVFETAAETPPTVGTGQQCVPSWCQLRRRDPRQRLSSMCSKLIPRWCSFTYSGSRPRRTVKGGVSGMFISGVARSKTKAPKRSRSVCPAPHAHPSSQKPPDQGIGNHLWLRLRLRGAPR